MEESGNYADEKAKGGMGEREALGHDLQGGATNKKMTKCVTLTRNYYVLQRLQNLLRCDVNFDFFLDRHTVPSCF